MKTITYEVYFDVEDGRIDQRIKAEKTIARRLNRLSTDLFDMGSKRTGWRRVDNKISN